MFALQERCRSQMRELHQRLVLWDWKGGSWLLVRRNQPPERKPQCQRIANSPTIYILISTAVAGKTNPLNPATIGPTKTMLRDYTVLSACAVKRRTMLRRGIGTSRV